MSESVYPSKRNTGFADEQGISIRHHSALEIMKALIMTNGGATTDDDMYNYAQLAVKGADRLRKALNG